MKGWLDGLAGAVTTAMLGLTGIMLRRLVYGHAEDEDMATRAAHQAVEAVSDVLSAMRTERVELLRENDRLRGRIVALERPGSAGDSGP